MSGDTTDFATTASGQTLQFHVVLTADQQGPAVVLDLGSVAAQLGIALGSGATVSMESALRFDFTFGIDRTPGTSALDSFFIHANSFLETQSLSTNLPALSAQLGFLGLQVQNTSQIVLNASESLALLNASGAPQGPSDSLTLSTLQNTPLTGLAKIQTVSALTSTTAPANGQIGATASFELTVGKTTSSTITLASNPNNTTLDGLVADLNAALAKAGLGGTVSAARAGAC